MHTSNAINRLDIEILAFLNAADRNEAFTAREIAHAVQYSDKSEIVATRLMALAAKGDLICHNAKTLGIVLYKALTPFRAVHFTPLFFGAPEWRVEHADGEQLALCKSEFHARLIANALNGDI